MTEVISRGEENLIAENHLPEEAPEEASSGRYSSSSLSETQKILLEQQIKFQFEKKKIYTDPELSLDKVAGILDTNNKYISQIINESFNSNFINFVNEFRIREARILLADPSYNQYTIETVAEMVGFKSKSAFNRAFKRITGLTPSFFQKTTIETHQFPETVMA